MKFVQGMGMGLKVVSTTCLAVCFLSLNDSTCSIRKNIFFFKSSFHSGENQILVF